MSGEAKAIMQSAGLSWPFGLQDGYWDWKSVADGDSAGTTVICINVQTPDRLRIQTWLTLDWADYDGRPEIGRGDAENTATLICAAINCFLKYSPPSDKAKSP